MEWHERPASTVAWKQAWGHWVDGAGLTLPLKVLRQRSSVHMGCKASTMRPWCILGSGIWSSGDGAVIIVCMVTGLVEGRHRTRNGRMVTGYGSGEADTKT